MTSSTAVVVSQFTPNTQTAAYYYNVLQLPATANEYDVLTRYRRLCLRYHPDKHQASTPEEKTHTEKLFNEFTLAKEFILKRIRLQKQIARLSCIPDELKAEVIRRFSKVDPTIFMKDAFVKTGLISRHSMVLHSLASPGQGGELKKDEQRLDREMIVLFNARATNKKAFQTAIPFEDFPANCKKFCINILAEKSTPAWLQAYSHWPDDDFCFMIDALQGIKTHLTPKELLEHFSYLTNEDDAISLFILALGKLSSANPTLHQLPILLDIARAAERMDASIFIDELIKLSTITLVTPELSAIVLSLIDMECTAVCDTLVKLAKKIHELITRNRFINISESTRQCYIDLLSWLNPPDLLPKLLKIPEHVTALFETLTALLELQRDAHPRPIIDVTYFDCVYDNAEFMVLDPNFKAKTSMVQVLATLISSSLNEKIILRILKDFAHINHLVLININKQAPGSFLADNLLNNALSASIKEIGQHACEPLQTTTQFKAFLHQAQHDGSTLSQRLSHLEILDIVNLAITINRCQLPLAECLAATAVLTNTDQARQLVNAMLIRKNNMNETLFRSLISEISEGSEYKITNTMTPRNW